MDLTCFVDKHLKCFYIFLLCCLDDKYLYFVYMYVKKIIYIYIYIQSCLV